MGIVGEFQFLLNNLRAGEFRRTLASGDFYKLLCYIFTPLCSLLILFLHTDYGITWDERMSIQYSKDIYRYIASFGSDKTCLDTSIPVYDHLIYYGNLFGLISELIYRIVPLNIVETRHLLNALLGIAGLLATMGIAKNTGGYKMAFAALVLLILSPRFFGHIMNDFRDTTFMTGFIASLYYFQKIAKKLPDTSYKDWFPATICVFIASAERIGGMILIPVLFSVLLISILRERKKISAGELKSIGAYFAGLSILSWFLMVMIWPWSHSNIVTKPLEALTTFTDLQLIMNYQLFRGEMIPNRDVPWDYLFTWIGITSPIAVLAGLALFPATLHRLLPESKTALLPVLIAAVFSILAYLTTVSNLYDGWRHFLFLAPLMALMSAAGWIGMARLLKKKFHRTCLSILVAILLVFPLSDMLALHPFQTLYFNELTGGIKGAYGEYELDIDGNSVRAGAEWLSDFAVLENMGNLRISANHDALSVSWFLDPGLFIGDIGWLAYGKTFLQEWDYAILTSRTLSSHQLLTGQWPYPESIHEVVADGVPIVSVLERRDRNLMYGSNELKAGNYAAAVEFLLKAEAYNPNLEDCHRLLGMSYMQLGEYENASKSFDRAFRLDPDNVALLYHIGELAYHTGDFNRAIHYLNKSKRTRLDNYRADYMLAMVYAAMRNFGLAQEHFKDLLQRHDVRSGDLSVILTEYGRLLMEMAREDDRSRMKLMDEAIAKFEKAIETDPRNISPYDHLSEIYSLTGREELAEDVVRRKKLITGK